MTNNSYVDIHDIEEGDDGALLCVTDLMQCCHRFYTANDRALGQWFYPNGTDVPINDYGYDFYRNRGHSILRLNRRNNASSPTGLYCCELPDSTFTTHRVCANIGGFLHIVLPLFHPRGCFVYTLQLLSLCSLCLPHLRAKPHLLPVPPALHLRLVSWNLDWSINFCDCAIPDSLT